MAPALDRIADPNGADSDADTAAPPAKPKRRRLRRFLRRSFTVLVFAGVCTFVAAYVVACAIAGKTESVDHPGQHGLPSALPPRDFIRVVSLNLAHGRATGQHQMLLASDAIRSNLDQAASVARSLEPDLVGLQEADGPSFWSGNFDHVAHFSRASGLTSSFRGAHVDGMGLSYGTAVVTREPHSNALAVTFEPTPPTFSKGFVRVTSRLVVVGSSGQSERNRARTIDVDLVSVHLDFASGPARQRQAETLIERLSPAPRPLIIAGDFNSDWADADGPLRRVAEALTLQAYEPESEDLETFPLTGSRLDWILIPADWEFVAFRTLPDELSDHRAIVADVRPLSP